MSPPVEPEPTFNWVFEYQPIAWNILTQTSRYKIAERNLLADEKGPQNWIQAVIWIICLYLYIYSLGIAKYFFSEYYANWLWKEILSSNLWLNHTLFFNVNPGNFCRSFTVALFKTSSFRDSIVSFVYMLKTKIVDFMTFSPNI